jgi:hypothetical protein
MDQVQTYREAFQELIKVQPTGKVTYQMPNRRQRKKILKALKK